jgi:small-conductance mechanosensitive channel
VVLQTPVGGDSDFSLIPGVGLEIQTNTILSVLVVLGVFIGRRAVLALVNRRVEDQELRYRWAKASANVAFAIAALFLTQVWFTALRSVGTFLGLLSAGLAISLKDLVADLAGWAFIAWRRPFELGDRIQIGDHAGDVVDRSLFQFTIMEIGNWVSADQSTGRLIHIPNAAVFTKPLANYVAGFPYLWNELAVLVTFESDWRKAKEVIESLATDLTVDITREANAAPTRGDQRFLIRYRMLTPVVYVTVQESGVMLTLRYLCRPRERRGSASQLWERLLDAFGEYSDVTLAYPTQRINISREALATDPDASPEVPEEPATPSEV